MPSMVKEDTYLLARRQLPEMRRSKFPMDVTKGAQLSREQLKTGRQLMSEPQNSFGGTSTVNFRFFLKRPVAFITTFSKVKKYNCTVGLNITPTVTY